MSDPWVTNVQTWINTTYASVPGIEPVMVDGESGWKTLYALTRALQYELGITTLSDSFGPGTLTALTTLGPVKNTTGNKNVIRIARAGLYCKGYNGGNGSMAGTWDSVTQAGVQKLRTDIGLTPGDGSVEPKLFKALLTTDAYVVVDGGNTNIRVAQRMLNGRYLNRKDFFIIPADGHYSRDVQRALMFALQYEIGLADGVANGNFGPATKSGLGTQANLSSGATDSSKHFVHLLHAALLFNGHNVAVTGTYGAATTTAVRAFQSFVALPITGKVDVATWGSLLVSTGDPDRPGTAADCISTLTPQRLTALTSAGYSYFGRYLTNTPDFDPDKHIKAGELERIFAAGKRVFPIFQTGGSEIEHFTYARGLEVGAEAANAAWAYRIPTGTTIYFAVDFDAYPSQVQDLVIPYFKGIHERIAELGLNYKIGVYGARNVCTMVTAAGYATYSFVSDMSTMYTGNLAHRLPGNWSFDQVQTLTVGAGLGQVEIDKNITSGRDLGFGSLGPAISVGNDPLVPSSKWSNFEEDWFKACLYYADSTEQQAVMHTNRAKISANVRAKDQFITNLATKYKVRKALILTPVIWEGMVTNPVDVFADRLVRDYYSAMEAGVTPLPTSRSDSSTGWCQIFAKTAIGARNWAIDTGLISEPKLNASNWRDMWAVWKKLSTDPEYNIMSAMFTMMMEAATREAAAPPSTLRNLTPSQVISMCYRYNGENDAAMRYGRRRAQLYYTIERWHHSFR